MPTRRSARPGAVGEFVRGASYVLRGGRAWSTSPRLMAWGLAPGLITFVALAAAFIAVATQVGSWAHSLASAITGDGALQGPLQVLLVVAMLGAAGVIAIYSFTAITLAIGGPFFERIAREMDADVPGVDSAPWWRGPWDSARLAIITVPLSAGVFLVSLVPGIGGLIAFTAGAAAGGWLLALELTSGPLSVRGVSSLAERRAVLREHRARSAGFGTAVFLVFLIPLGAVAMMPSAVAGGALLVRSMDPRAGSPAEQRRD